MKMQAIAICMALVLVQFATCAFAETALLQPGDNLVVEGVPKPALALVDEVNKYTEFRNAVLGSWHPREKRMLITTRFADTRQIHMVNAPAGARTQLTFFKDNVSGPRFQPTAGDYFIFSKDNGGNEFYQLYRYDFSDQSITLITDGKSRNTGPVFSHAGDRVAYGSTRRNSNDVDIYVVDPKDPKSNHMLVQLEGGP